VRAADIILRLWRDGDLPLLMALRNDVALQAKLLSTARGSDVDDVLAWLARRTAHDGLVFRVIAEAATAEPAGYIQAERTAAETSTWRFGICLAGPFQGAGRGPAAIRLMESLLVARGATTLTLEVDVGNARAISAYDALGFVEAERHLQHRMVCGSPRDVIVMEKPIGGQRPVAAPEATP
jgi:RimJ/RimL family protein N-acetyltransferase